MPSAYPDYRTRILLLLRDRPGLTVRQIADALQNPARQADGEFAGILSSLLTLTQAGAVRRESDRHYALQG